MPKASENEEITRADGQAFARRFGALLRQRRGALGMNQSDLALATGVGRRFIIDLEAGKPSCHIGKALLVAEALGIRVVDLMATRDTRSGSAAGTDLDLLVTEPPDIASLSVDDLPDLPDDIEEPSS